MATQNGKKKSNSSTLSQRIELKHLDDHLGKDVLICGWVRSVRDQKTFQFINLNDGSNLSGIQVIADEKVDGITTGTALAINGTVVESPAKGQTIEIKANTIEVLGTCPGEEYPLQKKRHSFEFLRTIAHLRPRTNTQGAIARVRSRLALATHTFFQNQDFLFLQSPIITTADCEGAGELFQITTLPLKNVPKDEEGQIDFKKDFFGKPTYLTVSGQLNAEAYACGLSKVYTFGPPFRAENSHTSRHIAEFWMVEPEMAFATLDDDIDLAENYLKHLAQEALTHCRDDLAFFDQFIEKGLIEKLENVIKEPFARITYTEAIELLEKSGEKFEFPIKWGTDLQSEHERYLAEKHFKKPVVLTDYPKEIKAFYMRDNDDGKTVAAMDVLLPGIGEVIGGAQREDRLDVLEKKCRDHNIDIDSYDWYLDLRRYGTVPHAGFGLGFERLVQFMTGVENIRDISPFPRVPGSANY
ncbi:MAG: asparagine--tRNA ligase [Simkaniaceae bacterium]|nr:asparagine--tRNA ligase [Simkaniaceae bacterium]